MSNNTYHELELWLGQLEQVPYRHSRAVQFLSYLYYNPQVVVKYSQIIGIAITVINQSSHIITDEPAIYAYQSAALIAHFTQPPLPQWQGIPTGECDRVAWIILQYYPSLSTEDKSLVQQWATLQLQLLQLQAHIPPQWMSDTSTILQYLAHCVIGDDVS